MSESREAHPPIPPGCEHFLRCPEWAFVFPTRYDQDPREGLVDLHYDGREHLDDKRASIIAAVAEVAWLREAERLGIGWRMAFDAGNDRLCQITHRQRVEAEDNARAWRKWGEGNG